MLDLATNRWQRMADSRVLGVSVASDYDPVSGHVFAFSDKNVLGEYDPKKTAGGRSATSGTARSRSRPSIRSGGSSFGWATAT
jgi:hypothetical protein